MATDPGEQRQRAAEEVRRHLVALRGGAPFLSPDDGVLLERWLADGITVPTIVHALERAADARRKRPSRIPLSLQAARRHLHKPSRGALPRARLARAGGDHPLSPLAGALRERARDDVNRERLEALAGALLALDPADRGTLEADAQALIRDFLLATWESLSPWEREARLTTAREELGTLAEALSPQALQASLEAIARDHIRRDHPMLTAATLRQVLDR